MTSVLRLVRSFFRECNRLDCTSTPASGGSGGVFSELHKGTGPSLGTLDALDVQGRGSHDSRRGSNHRCPPEGKVPQAGRTGTGRARAAAARNRSRHPGIRELRLLHPIPSRTRSVLVRCVRVAWLLLPYSFQRITEACIIPAPVFVGGVGPTAPAAGTSDAPHRPFLI